jgi:ABC-type transport system substrate-binding protein
MVGKTRSRARRRVSFVVAIVLCVSAMVAAASSGSGASVAAQSGQGKIDKNAVLRMGIGLGDLGGSTFDPADNHGNPYTTMFQDAIFDVFIHDTPDGKGSPGLAAKWSTPDAQTAEITLQPNVKFTDGSPFNAAAVKGAWDRLLQINPTYLPTDMRAITNIEAVGDNVVRVHFNKPVAQTFVDNRLHHSQYTAVPSPANIAANNINTKPVGAGPYMLSAYTPDQKVTVTKNPNYWNPKAQLLGGIEWSQASSGQPAVSALQSGTVDLIWSIPPDSIPAIKSNPNFAVTALPGTRVFDIGLCATNGVFANKQARQALQYAIDRNAISQGAWTGIAPPAQSIITPVSPYYNKKLDHSYSFNPKKAKALLKQAGVAPGTTISGLAPTSIPNPAIAEIVQSQLKDVGLNLQYTISSDLVNEAANKKPDVLFVSFDPSLWSLAFTQFSTLNICNWSNPQVTADLAVISDATKTDQEKKTAATDLQKTVLDESPVIVTTLGPLTAAHTKNVQGIKVITNPFGPNLDTVYMTKS